jgi:DNA modification methylase
MKVKVNKLKHHPLNERIYQLTGIDELVESIKTVGLLQNLTITNNNEVIDGNRRFEAIKRLNWVDVEVNRINVPKGEETLLLIHFNQQRVKSVRELINEHNELKPYYKLTQNIKGKKVRNLISENLNISDGSLARILVIEKNRPDLIDLIDKGIITINQAYITVQREVEEKKSRSSIGNDFNSKITTKKEDFKFYKKSSHHMKELEDGEVNTIFTSIPYYNARMYGNKPGIGNEKTPEEYIENISNHLIDCFRVLHKKGSFFLNIGDTFIDGHLQSIPHRIILKLLEKSNFKLRNTIIWSKSNYKPSSTKTNLTASYEYIFHLVKDKEYFYKRVLMPISKNTKPSHPPRHRNVKGEKVKSLTGYIPNPLGKNMPDYWSEDVIKTSVSNQLTNNGIEHPAMFPINMFTVPIIQTSIEPFLGNKNENINSLILDPFCGALTVYKGLKELNSIYGTNLRFVGYDIKKYF